MKVSKNWLTELVELKTSMEEITRLLPLRTIAIKEFAPDYFELDMKGYNRADLLSLRGIAREVAAITDSRVTFKEIASSKYIWSGKNLPQAKVEVKNDKLAPLYCLAKIEGLKAGKSPAEWIKRLNDSGMRSVNNIADITNLVMLEYGQPSHAFDADTVAHETIIVRTAKDGEKITTLDNKMRELTTADLLIADPEKPLGIAGVMGGKNSEVNSQTTAILLEAAIFDPVNLRNTALRLGLPSEASKRFQHGLTKKRLLQALDAAIRMYQSLGGQLTALTIAGDFKDKVSTVILTQSKINSLVGVDVKPKFIEESLTKLHFQIEKTRAGEWRVTAPYWRLDIEVEEDLIEEVARLYGYENIPAKQLGGELPLKIDQQQFEVTYNIKKKLVELGLTEIQTYSFYSTGVINNLQIDKKDLIKITNPMSAETEYMRNQLWPNVLEAAVKNLKTRDDLAIFEVGKVYLPASRLGGPKTNFLPEEKYQLAAALSSQTTTSIQELYMYLLKMAENFNYEFEIKEGDGGELFHPVRFAKIYHRGKEVGFITEVHPRITNKFGVEKRLAVLEIRIEPFLKSIPAASL